jgi:hypothetical protein
MMRDGTPTLPMGRYNQAKSRFGTGIGSSANYVILDAIEPIEPGTQASLPLIPPVGDTGNTSRPLPKDYIEAWRKTHESLGRKYLKAK